MTAQEIISKIQSFLSESELDIQESYGMTSITIPATKNVDLIQFLKDDTEIQMIFLTDVTGANYPDKPGQELQVIYHLHSFIHNVRLRIKCNLGIESPEIDSVVHIHAGANWMERETYDFFGIIFKNHPNLERILNVDEMDYFPLRKEYPLEDQLRTDKEDKYFGR